MISTNNLSVDYSCAL